VIDTGRCEVELSSLQSNSIASVPGPPSMTSGAASVLPSPESVSSPAPPSR
jgi:hypothetical protein